MIVPPGEFTRTTAALRCPFLSVFEGMLDLTLEETFAAKNGSFDGKDRHLVVGTVLVGEVFFAPRVPPIQPR